MEILKFIPKNNFLVLPQPFSEVVEAFAVTTITAEGVTYLKDKHHSFKVATAIKELSKDDYQVQFFVELNQQVYYGNFNIEVLHTKTLIPTIIYFVNQIDGISDKEELKADLVYTLASTTKKQVLPFDKQEVESLENVTVLSSNFLFLDDEDYIRSEYL